MEPNHGSTVVVFDFDGVICNSFYQFIQVFNDIAPYYNLTKVCIENLTEIRNHKPKDLLKKHGLSSCKIPIVVYHMRKNLRPLY